jgi:site-specific DNA-cytosine methylase
MSQGINVLSLFDGIAATKVALDRLNVKVNRYYTSEIDKYAIQVVCANHEDVIQLGDIHGIMGVDIPDHIDLLIGGFPCQDLSFAGHQKGFEEGTRSSLFFEFLRLLKEVQPVWFLVENVRMQKGCEDMISEALGVSPIMINSNLVSAQNRRRNYWTNIPDVQQPRDRGLVMCDCLESLPLKTKEVMYTDVTLNGSSSGVIGHISKKPNQATRIYATNGKSRCIIANGGGQGSKTGLYAIPGDPVTYRKLTPRECEAMQTFPLGYTDLLSCAQRYKCLGNSFTVDVVAHILSYAFVSTS